MAAAGGEKNGRRNSKWESNLGHDIQNRGPCHYDTATAQLKLDISLYIYIVSQVLIPKIKMTHGDRIVASNPDLDLCWCPETITNNIL